MMANNGKQATRRRRYASAQSQVCVAPQEAIKSQWCYQGFPILSRKLQSWSSVQQFTTTLIHEKLRGAHNNIRELLSTGWTCTFARNNNEFNKGQCLWTQPQYELYVNTECVVQDPRDMSRFWSTDVLSNVVVYLYNFIWAFPGAFSLLFLYNDRPNCVLVSHFFNISIVH